MREVDKGGGWPAVFYTFRKARQAGGLLKLWSAMRSKNACKTCALGMGGQSGGMVNEAGHFPEVCKKSLQAMTADMQAAIPAEFFQTYSIRQLQTLSPRELEACGRLTVPLLLTQGSERYVPISWDEAYVRIVANLRAVAPRETFWYFSGRSSNEAGFLLQLFARLYGTNNVNNCSFYCHQASGVGLSSSVGNGTATVTLDDVEKADCVFIVGGNPASNHPRLMRTLMTVRREGGKVVVINPVIETGLVNFAVPSDVQSLLYGTPIASVYVQPDIGGDAALLTGVAKRIVELKAHDPDFVAAYCDGGAEYLEWLQALSWADVARKAGVELTEIDAIATCYAKAQNTVFAWTMGITHHANGVENVQAIVNLALLRGMVGRPNAGLLPIRGHSNVQGMGSMGVTPQLKDAVFKSLQDHFNVKLPTETGLDTMACIEGAAAGTLRMGFCLGGNLYGSNPDSTYAARALSKLDTVVYLNTTLNTGHAHGLAASTLILPVLARDEEPQATTQESMFNFVRLSDGGPARHAGPRSEIAVISELAQRVLGAGGPVDWAALGDTNRIREAIGKIVPGWAPVAEIGTTKREFHIPGRILHTPTFPTASGKARFHRFDLPELAGRGSGELRLMTVRSEGQFNTVVYEDEDLYRGQDRRDIVLLNPSDIERMGLRAETRVTVSSATGSMPNLLVRAFEKIKPGNALMYYPEANVLVSRRVDPKSKTPSFKNIVVTIRAS
jgi:molybdopterin-dependent oxidoreductase alpha subunit